MTHQLWERMSLGLTGTYGRDEYQNPDRTDWNWGLAGNLSYQPLKWMTVSLEASNNVEGFGCEWKQLPGQQGGVEVNGGILRSS